MADIWNQNEELDGEEELVVTDHRDSSTGTGVPQEEAPQEELPLEEFRALEDSDQQSATTSPEDRRGEGESEQV